MQLYQPEELAGLAVSKINMQQREEKTADQERRYVENIKQQPNRPLTHVESRGMQLQLLTCIRKCPNAYPPANA